MRKVQLILGFLLFCFQIWGQGRVRTFSEQSSFNTSFNSIDAIDLDTENEWLFSCNCGSSNGYHFDGYILKAYYNRALDSLGIIKLVYNDEFGLSQEMEFKPYSKVFMGFYSAYPFFQVHHVNFLGNQTYPSTSYWRQYAATFNLQQHQNKWYCLLGNVNLDDYKNGIERPDSLFLTEVTMRADSLSYMVVDTFALPLSIRKPGTFIYHTNHRIEYINDSMRYVFNRDAIDADTIEVYKNSFFTEALSEDSYGAFYIAKTRNKRILNGLYKVVYDSLNYDLLRTHTDRFNQTRLVNALRLPDYCLNLGPGERFYPLPVFQQDSVVCLSVYQEEVDVLRLLRYEGSDLVKETSFQLPPKFWPMSMRSLKNGSFVIGGSMELGNRWNTSYSRASLIIIDPQGRSSILQGAETFNLHYNTTKNTLQVFYEDQEYLEYRILDVSGRSMKNGRMRVARGVSLGDWRTGVYYLQLWTDQGAYLGTRSFLKN